MTRIRTFSNEQCAKQQVVLVHCSASSANQWCALEERLGPAFETTKIDLYGHGTGPGWAGKGPLTLDAEARNIKVKIAAGPAGIHLVGHSYGGSVALKYACNWPHQTASLTLIEPSSFHLLKDIEEYAPQFGEISRIAATVNEAVVCGDFRLGMRKFIDYWAGQGTWERLDDRQKERFSRLAVHVAHHFWSLMEEKPAIDLITRLDVPTLILCGTNSPAPSRAITRLLADAIPASKHRTIAYANHMTAVTNPDKINDLILEHLQQNLTAGLTIKELVGAY
jgi:pimeloyl-ACP methyl ester carboxylesterase